MRFFDTEDGNIDGGAWPPAFRCYRLVGLGLSFSVYCSKLTSVTNTVVGTQDMANHDISSSQREWKAVYAGWDSTLICQNRSLRQQESLDTHHPS